MADDKDKEEKKEGEDGEKKEGEDDKPKEPTFWEKTETVIIVVVKVNSDQPRTFMPLACSQLGLCELCLDSSASLSKKDAPRCTTSVICV